jgi:hypothetical protein
LNWEVTVEDGSIQRDLQDIRDNLATLNDIMMEMVAKVSDDAEFVRMVYRHLADHQRAIGYRLNAVMLPPREAGE